MNTLRYTSKQKSLGLALSLLTLFCLVALQACKPATSAETDTTPQKVAAPSVPHVASTSAIEAGRYIVRLGGCNDCHTAGYDQALGQIPESEWLTGMPIGFKGPWGTSYPQNLRLRVQQWDEDTWVTILRERKALPPMPWPSLNAMSEKDARAVYQFIKSLGPKGTEMPGAIPAGQEPETPYILFEPLHMERMSL